VAGGVSAAASIAAAAGGGGRAAVAGDAARSESVTRRGRRQTGGGDCESVGSQRPLGATNGDCDFDVVDVGYVSEYVVEAAVGFEGMYGAAFTSSPPSNQTLERMDADGNGVVDSNDVLHLSRGLVEQTRFVSLVSYGVVASTDCVLRLEAVVTNGDGTADVSSANSSQTIVYFLLASNATSTFPSLFAASVDDCDVCEGTVLTNDVSSMATTATTAGGLIKGQQSSTNSSVCVQSLCFTLVSVLLLRILHHPFTSSAPPPPSPLPPPPPPHKTTKKPESTTR